LVPVGRMSLKQLRGVVQELQTGAGEGAPAGLEQSPAGRTRGEELSAFAWRPPTGLSPERAAKEKGWTRSTASGRGTKTYTPKQYRSPPVRPKSRFAIESKARTELLKLQSLEDARGAPKPMHGMELGTAPSPATVAVDNRRVADARRQKARELKDPKEGRDKWVTWDHMQTYFQTKEEKDGDEAQSKSKPRRTAQPRHRFGDPPSPQQLAGARGLTVTDMMGRSSPTDPSKRQALFNDADAEPLAAPPQHSDPRMHGASLFNGMYDTYRMNDAQKKRVLQPPPAPLQDPYAGTDADDIDGDEISALQDQVRQMRAEKQRYAAAEETKNRPEPRVGDVNTLLAKLQAQAERKALEYFNQSNQS